VFLRLEDGRLADHSRLLFNRLIEILDGTNAEEIFVPSIIDTHPDHRILAEVGRELARVRRDRPLLVYEYPIWFWDPKILGIGELLKLRVRIVRMEQLRARKREAIAAYCSQVTNVLARQAGRRASGFCDNFYGPKRCFLRYRSHNVQLHSRSAEEFDLGLGGTTGNLRVWSDRYCSRPRTGWSIIRGSLLTRHWRQADSNHRSREGGDHRLRGVICCGREFPRCRLFRLSGAEVLKRTQIA
jgi:hypothetical protein